MIDPTELRKLADERNECTADILDWVWSGNAEKALRRAADKLEHLLAWKAGLGETLARIERERNEAHESYHSLSRDFEKVCDEEERLKKLERYQWKRAGAFEHLALANEKRAEKAEAALERLVNAATPVDMWLGGIWANQPTDAERHEFVLALSAAMSLVQSGDTTSGTQQTPASPGDSAPSVRTESEDPGSC